MNEAAARQTLLVRAYERAPSPHWSEADRDWATQAAAHITGEQASDDAFIAHRAALAVERLRGRDSTIARLLDAVTWRRWIGHTLVIAAFAAGLAADAIGSERRVNLLAPPLLGLLAWNLFVYALIVVRSGARVVAAARRTAGPAFGPFVAAFARVAHAIAPAAGQLGGGAGSTFLADWAQAARTLTAARVGRVLHASAIVFALGMLASLYLRGLAFDYRAGWESTFLDASHVHALLAVVLGPASQLTGIALPDAAALQGMRFPAAAGVNAAPWLHLYAVTVVFVVLLPRALLALADRWLEARWSAHFKLPLDDVYYRGLTRSLRATGDRVRVLPYALQLSPQAALGLNAVLTRACGAKTTVEIGPTTVYGDEDRADLAVMAPDVTVVAPIFALAATPEPENHGAFVVRVRANGVGGARLLALVDESSFVRQFGAASPRRAERRDAWRHMLDELDCPAVFVDCERPDAASEADLMRALDAPAQVGA